MFEQPTCFHTNE